MSIVNIMAGRLTGDPECKATQSGTTMTNFSLADNQGKDKDGKDKVTFFRCSAFGKQGEMILASCRKGHRLNIVGRLETREYTDNSGQHRVSMDVTVHDFGFIEPRDTTPASAPQQTAPAGYTPPPGYGQQPAPQAPPMQQQPQYTRDAAGNMYQMINGQWVMVPPAQTSRPQQRPSAPAPQQPQQLQPQQGFGQPFNPNDVPF